MMISERLVAIGIIFFFGSILQGAVGFAFGLFAIPMLVWAGINLSEAVAITSVSIFIQVLVSTYQLRIYIKWREVLSATVVRYFTVPIGIMLLLALDTLDKSQIKQILGAIILLILCAQIFWKVKPQERSNRNLLVLAFSISGIMQGMVAMGGPPAVLWVMTQRWTSKQIRAFLLTLFLLVAPFQIILLYVSANTNISEALLIGFAFTPVVILGSILGVQLGNFIAVRRLRQMALGILLITALISIMSPILE